MNQINLARHSIAGQLLGRTTMFVIISRLWRYQFPQPTWTVRVVRFPPLATELRTLAAQSRLPSFP